MTLSSIASHAAAGIALGVIGFVAGRRSAPERERVVEVVKYQDRVVYKERIAQRVAGSQRVRSTRTVAKKPDGTVIEKETHEAVVRQEIAKEASKEAIRTVYQEVVRERIVERKHLPNWQLHLFAGVNGPALLGGSPAWFGGVAVQRRILGPVFGGAAAFVGADDFRLALSLGATW